MKSLLVIGLTLVAALAQADIRRPEPRGEVEKMEIEGEAARELHESLKGSKVRDMAGDSLRTYVSSYRVFESDDMLARIICKRERSFREDAVFSCAVESSKNGEPLKQFIPRRRMG